jgi:Flp pilus assembly protein TadG
MMVVSGRAAVARFLSADTGSITIIFALVLPLLVMTAGVAVDAARWFYAMRSTTAALDAAVLAGARVLQLNPDDPTAAIAAATKVYTGNVAARVKLESDTVSFITADGNKAVTAKGSAYIATTLLSIAGFDRLPVASENGAGFPKASLASGGSSGSNLEIAIVLDVTGSMCEDGHGPCTSGEKISGLKAAAADLVDIAVLSDQSKLTSKAAIVPFATRIRVGPDKGGADRMKALTNLDPTWTGWYNMCTQSSGGGSSENNGDWSCQHYESQHLANVPIMPCVTDRFYNSGWRYDYTDAKPGSSAWLNAHGGDRMPHAEDSSDNAPASGSGKTKADPANHWNYESGGGCADVSANNEIVPLTADRTKLKARINSLEAFGSTSGALGTAWGWYMLSPNWKSIFQGESEPQPYSDLTTLKPSGAPVLRKVVVIMSDGGYNTLRGWKDQDQQTVSNHAKQLCSNMKGKGIEVFTVGFALDKLPSGERAVATDTLKSCGTDVRHFYETLTVQDLKVAFRDIAVQMGALHLSK